MTNWTDFPDDQTKGVFITVQLLQQIIDNTTNIYERIQVLQSLAGGITPVGAILLWSGTYATIPDGFQLADGTNGTPDLRGKFLLGISASEDDDDLLGTGGETQHTHTMGTISNASQHKHTAHLNDNIYANTYKAGVTPVSAASHSHSWSATTNNADEHTHTGVYNSADHLPPYTKYYWIARIPA